MPGATNTARCLGAGVRDSPGVICHQNTFCLHRPQLPVWGTSCDHVPHTTTPLSCHSSCTDRSCMAQCWVPLASHVPAQHHSLQGAGLPPGGCQQRPHGEGSPVFHGAAKAASHCPMSPSTLSVSFSSETPKHQTGRRAAAGPRESVHKDTRRGQTGRKQNTKKPLNFVCDCRQY